MSVETIGASIAKNLRALAEFTATPGNGVTRFPFTEQAKQASDYLKAYMEQAGLSVRMDNSGSVIGRLEGARAETVMMGSHLDSVKNGGAYDGIAGAVCGVECARLFQERGIKPYYSLEVIATNDEEGSRFKSGLFTGKVLFGQLRSEDIKGYKDDDNISVYQAMEEYGLHPEEIGLCARTDLKAFIEIHIEQGPVLEQEQKQIGIVDTIVGIQRLFITIHGRADHIGTMPMMLRMDALEAAAKVIAGIGDKARELPPAVATVGNITVTPNIVNIIPSEVSFTVDYRGTTPEMILEQHDAIMEDLARISDKYRVSYECKQMLNAAPVHMDKAMTKMIEQSCAQHGFSNMHIISGAGHDAQVFGAQIPTAMIFVPSENGRSHCPEEKSDELALAQAVIVACDMLEQMNRGKTL